MIQIAHLPGRAVVAVDGPDRTGFLQGLVSNDVAALESGRAMWAALLTPQGKYETDFLLVADEERGRILLDAPAADAAALATKLSRFRLRSAVTVGVTDLAVFAGWNGSPPDAAPGGIVALDARLPDAGWRLLGPADAAPELNASEEDWDRHRLLLGLPDGARDLEPGRSVLLEAGFDELGGVSWTKGCYMGQELTARTRYRGLLKRRLVPVQALEGSLPAPGSVLLGADGREAGTMRSSRDDRGLASVRLEHLGAELRAGESGAALRTRVPDWMRLPLREDA